MDSNNDQVTGTISDKQEQSAIAMLDAFAQTAEPYQHPLHLLHHLATSVAGEGNLQQAFDDIQIFIKALITFFLNPANSKAFIKSGGSVDDLLLFLPALLDTFCNLAASDPGAAMLELEQYRFAGLAITTAHHNYVVKHYGSRLHAYYHSQQNEQAA